MAPTKGAFFAKNKKYKKINAYLNKIIPDHEIIYRISAVTQGIKQRYTSEYWKQEYKLLLRKRTKKGKPKC